MQAGYYPQGLQRQGAIVTALQGAIVTALINAKEAAGNVPQLSD